MADQIFDSNDKPDDSVGGAAGYVAALIVAVFVMLAALGVVVILAAVLP
jgi:hypothetical protein